jgi:hypothetical protein
LDQLIRAPQQRWRDRQPERPGRSEIYHQLELRRLLDRKVVGLGALEALVNEGGRAPKPISIA